MPAMNNEFREKKKIKNKSFDLRNKGYLIRKQICNKLETKIIITTILIMIMFDKKISQRENYKK